MRQASSRPPSFSCTIPSLTQPFLARHRRRGIPPPSPFPRKGYDVEASLYSFRTFRNADSLEKRMLPCLCLNDAAIMRYRVGGMRFAPWPEIRPPMGPAKGQSPSATSYAWVLRTVIRERGGVRAVGVSSTAGGGGRRGREGAGAWGAVGFSERSENLCSRLCIPCLTALCIPAAVLPAAATSCR